MATPGPVSFKGLRYVFLFIFKEGDYIHLIKLKIWIKMARNARRFIARERDLRSEFKNQLNKNNVRFARITDKSVNFVLCQFQNKNSFCNKKAFQ